MLATETDNSAIVLIGHTGSRIKKLLEQHDATTKHLDDESTLKVFNKGKELYLCAEGLSESETRLAMQTRATKAVIICVNAKEDPIEIAKQIKHWFAALTVKRTDEEAITEKDINNLPYKLAVACVDDSSSEMPALRDSTQLGRMANQQFGLERDFIPAVICDAQSKPSIDKLFSDVNAAVSHARRSPVPPAAPAAARGGSWCCLFGCCKDDDAADNYKPAPTAP